MNRWGRALAAVLGRDEASPPQEHDESAAGGGEPGPAASLAGAGAAGTPTVPYAEVASAELDARAAALLASGAITVWATTGVAPSLRMDGRCPRCDDGFSQTTSLRLPVSSIRGERKGAQAGPVSSDFLCDCDVSHPGAPDSVRGCGASFFLALPPDQGVGDG